MEVQNTPDVNSDQIVVYLMKLHNESSTKIWARQEEGLKFPLIHSLIHMSMRLIFHSLQHNCMYTAYILSTTEAMCTSPTCIMHTNRLHDLSICSNTVHVPTLTGLLDII